jgi:thiol-disulfide isomerase/thioredoxin
MDDAHTALPDPVVRSRWSTVAWLGASLLLVVLVVAVWLRVGGERQSANLANAIIEGKRPAAPALPHAGIARDGAPGLPGWYRAGTEHQRANARGEVLVVNWWASWCGPCEQEAPALREIAHDYDGRVTVVGLNAGSQDLESDARAFVRRHELDFSIVRGDRTDEDAWGVNGFPETFVVGTDGRISSYVNGPIDEETLRGLLDRELGEDRT